METGRVMCRTTGINCTEGIKILPGGVSLWSSDTQSNVHTYGCKDDLLWTYKRFDYKTKFLCTKLRFEECISSNAWAEQSTPYKYIIGLTSV